MRRDDKDGLTPRLARAVPSLENGDARLVGDGPDATLVVTFHLREGLVWQDGAALTSDDVRMAWELDRAAPLTSPLRRDADLVARVDTPDAATAVLVLVPGARPSRYPLLARVMPRHLAAALGTAAYAHHPVHAGPFSVASWQEGTGATLVAFDRYALGKPGLSRIEVRFFADREALLDALSRGTVDVAPSGALEADLGPRIERFAEERGLVPRYTPQQSSDVLLFDLRRAPYRDERVRRAVALTVDRRAIDAALFSGRARLPASFVFAPSWAASDVPTLPDPDPDAARALVAAAGYCATTRCAGAPALPARILVEGGSAPREAAAGMVARSLASIGAATTVVVLPRAAIEAALASGDFDLALVRRSWDGPAEAAWEYETRAAANVTGYADPSFDALAAEAAALLSRPDRRPLYAELERLWTTDLPGLPLYQILGVDVVPAALEGVAPTAVGEPLSWNAWAWRFPAR